MTEGASGDVRSVSVRVRVRPSTPDDAAAVAGLWWRARLAALPAIPAPVHSEDDVRRWVTEVLVPAGGTWVAETDGGVVAMMTLGVGVIEQLYVDPAVQGQGVGSLLVDLAKQRGGDGLELWTFQSNAGARRFYERHGFVPVGTTEGDNEEGAPDVRYRWAATAPRAWSPGLASG